MNDAAIAALRQRSIDAGVQSLLISIPLNLQYLIGYQSNAYSRPIALILPSQGAPTFIVPRLEALQAAMLTRLSDIRSYVEWPEGSRAGGNIDAEFRALLREVLRERNLLRGRLGIERATLTSSREPALHEATEGTDWVDVSGWVESLRLIKSPEEVENFRRAARVAAAGLDAGLAAARVGASELEIRGAGIHAAFDAAATLATDLPIIVNGNALAGKRTAAIHAPAGRNRPAEGDLVFLVLAVSVGSSTCELSRTIVIGGRPTAEQLRLFRAVGQAHEVVRDLARPGAIASDLDLAARRTLAEFKLAEYLPMRTGHGLGAAGVESPNLGAADPTPLQAGMVLSIEPGVCIPDFGAMLWAENYLVTQGGAEKLTNYAIDLS